MPDPAPDLEPQPEPEPSPEPQPEPEPSPEGPYAYLPENWRHEFAGVLKDDASDEDKEAHAKRVQALERYSTFQDYLDSTWEAKARISAGVAKELPENPTDEQLTEYRKQHGLPENTEDYTGALKYSEGVVPGEGDQIYIDEVVKWAHEQHLAPDKTSALIEGYIRVRDKEAEQLQTNDNLHKAETEKIMKEHWGPDYQANHNMIGMFINSLPEGVRENYMSARMPDGRALLNSPEYQTAMADLMRKAHPSATIVPMNENAGQSIAQEIKDIEAKIGTPEYDKDKAMQTRLMELYRAEEAMEKGKKRA